MVHAETNQTTETENSSRSRMLQRTAYATFDSGQWVDAKQMPKPSEGWNGYFYIEGAISWGFCAQNTVSGWYNNQVKGGYIVEWDDATVRKILYYAPGSPGYTGTNIAYDMDNATYATGYMNGDSNNNTRAQNYIASLAGLTDPIVYGYKAYYMYNSETDYQDVAFLGVAPRGALQIIKYSTNSNLTNNNSNYSLAGAVYGVYAEDGEYSTPEYTITLSEWADGWSGLAQGVKYGWGKIEGLPPGNYWIKEITAPKGFELDPNWYPSYHESIYVGSNATATIQVEDEPKLIQIDLLKKQENSDVVIPNATFEHKRPDGTTEVIATDENGWLKLTEVSYGVHEIREISVMDGYQINENVISFSVEDNKKITMLTELDTSKGNVEWLITEEGNIEVTVYDKVVPFSLVICKQNNMGTALEGARFALYRDAACTDMLQEGITDAEGKIEFAGLTVETKYYLKEIEAPTGYRISTDENGNPIVTELEFSNIPAKGELKFYLDGTEYAFDSENPVILTGTEAEPKVELVVLNEAGYRLPQTGSSEALILCYAAVFCYVMSTTTKKRGK